jgi:hypothetical protein
MSVKNSTIDFVRSLVSEGDLDRDKIASLAKWLKENPEARTCWPGSVLYETIEIVLEDRLIEEDEVQALSNIIKDVEHRFDSEAS